MSDVEQRIREGLEPVLELPDPRPRISAYHDMPYALFRYDPEDELELRKQVTLLDRKKIGLNTQVFAQIKLNAHGRKNLTDFAEAMHQFPEVLECHVLMGAVDFMLRIVTRDIESYERFFFEKLSAVPGIQEVNSIVALSEIKSTTTLPLLAP